MDNPLVLSICIPTYNRAECLKQCLESIIDQFSNPQVVDKVEIVISDNASEDNTATLVANFQNNFSNISYSRNERNLGFDRNLLLVVEKASGEYCWLLGDDDALFPQSLGIVINEIQQSRLAYYLANTLGYDHELQNPALSKPNLAITHNQEYSQLKDFILTIRDYTNVAGCFGGISAQIFKKELWQNFSEKERYLDTQVVHFYTILRAMKYERMMVFAIPLVKTRAANINWAQVPGFETSKKRAEKTKQGVQWIYNFYDIPYSKYELEWHFLKDRFQNQLLFFIKNYILRNNRFRDIIVKYAKKLLRK